VLSGVYGPSELIFVNQSEHTPLGVCQVILLEYVPFVLWLYGIQLSSYRTAVSLVAITLSLRGLPFDHVAVLVDLVEVFDPIESHAFASLSEKKLQRGI
tara:strand:- start:7821 stop:8117 length:297 start_codon:yes stop_codon:yes gene_type:complete